MRIVKGTLLVLLLLLGTATALHVFTKAPPEHTAAGHGSGDVLMARFIVDPSGAMQATGTFTEICAGNSAATQAIGCALKAVAGSMLSIGALQQRAARYSRSLGRKLQDTGVASRVGRLIALPGGWQILIEIRRVPDRSGEIYSLRLRRA